MTKEEMEGRKEQQEFMFIGHKGPVYSVSISLDDKFIISGSFDCTVRLWSLQTRQILAVYHGHSYPIWHVTFAPLGLYFLSCSNDRTAKLWLTKNHTPVRIFVGHLGDVTCGEFHPNLHYVATASNDKQIRLWSCKSGECVRMMFTVAGAVRALKFNKVGNHLMAGNEYGVIVIFEVNKAVPLHLFTSCQTKAIWSMDISQDDSLLAVGTEEGTIELYSFQKILTSESSKLQIIEQKQHSQQFQSKSHNQALLSLYKTKTNGILLCKFTWRNFLYAGGCIERSYF